MWPREKIGLQSPFVKLLFQICSTNEMLLGVFKAAMVMYISYKFGGLLSGTSAVNCVQQASISTQVNLSTFTKGQHVCVLLLLVRW